jgi:hypothetical protein
MIVFQGRLSKEHDRMNQVIIENPIINSPFEEPTRHFRFADEGITNEVVDGRRISSYFIPIAKPKQKGAKQLHFDTEWTQDRIEENKLVNNIRRRVAMWRQGGYLGVTPTTARLIAYWTDPTTTARASSCGTPISPGPMNPKTNSSGRCGRRSTKPPGTVSTARRAGRSQSPNQVRLL